MSWDPDFQGAVSGALLDDDFAAVNLGVGAGGVSKGYPYIIIFNNFPQKHKKIPKNIKNNIFLIGGQ